MKLITAALVLAPTLALAQPGGDEPPPPTPPQPVVNPPPQPPPQPPQPVVHEHEAKLGEDHPSELAFAIGLGYILPTSLETPNVTSVRLRLPSGLTFEPRIAFANSSQTTGMTGNETTTSTTELGLGALVRYPAIVHGKVDLEIVGLVDLDNTKINPDGADNDTTTTTFTIAWGLALDYWFTHHWNLSLTATNPLFSYTTTSMEMGAGVESKNSTTNVGLIFDPVVALMVHLYN